MSNFVANLDEIVFRRRNKDYGAYVLRKEYSKNTLRAMILGVLFAVAALVVPLLISKFKPFESDQQIVLDETTAVLEEPPPMDEEEELPEEVNVEPPPPPSRSEIRFVPPEVVEHEEAEPEVTIASVDTIQKIDIGTKNIIGDDDAPPTIGITEIGGKGNKPIEVEVAEKEPDPDAFIIVEKKPEPVNMDEFKRLIVYPPLLKEMGTNGTVFVRVLIGKDGKVKRHIIKRTPHELMSDEVVKHLSKLRFTPAIQAGKPVEHWANVPVRFNLD